jgi:hypothetical protein
MKLYWAPKTRSPQAPWLLESRPAFRLAKTIAGNG